MKTFSECREPIFVEHGERPPVIPPSLERYKLPLVHEGGHLAYVLAMGRRIKAYNIAGAIVWASEQFPEKTSVARARLSDNEGVVSYDTAGMNPEQVRESAAAGTAAELVYFGCIESTAREQRNDREKGGFGSIWEMQATADGLADNFESGKMAGIFRFVMQRIVEGRGFDDVNEAIGRGEQPGDFIKKITLH